MNPSKYLEIIKELINVRLDVIDRPTELSDVKSTKLNFGDESAVAWWTKGLLKNQQQNSEPLVIMKFAIIKGDTLTGEVVSRTIPQSLMGKVRIGTIWKNGLCDREVEWETCEFDVNYSKNGWYITSELLAEKFRYPHCYPVGIHAAGEGSQFTKLICFKLNSVDRLVIPCLEFFTRCYGYSSQLRKLLLTYPWHKLKEEGGRVFLPPNSILKGDEWVVNLRCKLAKADSIILAHAKNDQFAEDAISIINKQMQKQFIQNNIQPINLEIEPWFEGPAKLLVKGIRFNGNSFLVLKIEGGSDPQGNYIIWESDKKIKVKTNPLSSNSSRPVRSIKNYPQIHDITDSQAPDSDAFIAKIFDDDFQKLGTPRTVLTRKINPKQQKTTGASNSYPSTAANSFSTADSSGKWKGVDEANFLAPTMIQAEDTPMEAWNALIRLHKMKSNQFQHPEWYEFTNGFQTNTPTGVFLNEFTNEDELPDDKHWLYVNKALKQARKIYIFRIKINNTQVHFLEVQRRSIKVNGGGDKKIDGEESMKGLAFILNDENSFNETAEAIASKIRYTNREMGTLMLNIPAGRKVAYLHNRKSDTSTKGLSFILLALEHLSIIDRKTAKELKQTDEMSINAPGIIA